MAGRPILVMIMNTTYNRSFSLGEISIGFSRNEFTDTLLSEFPNLNQAETEPTITVEPKSGFRPPPEGHIKTSDDCYITEKSAFIDNRPHIPRGVKRMLLKRIGQNGYQTLIRRRGPGEYHINLHYDKTIFSEDYKLLRKAFQFRNGSYFTRQERVAKNFLYDTFEPVLQLGLLEQDRSFLHASGVRDGDETVLFTGWGGAGKTSVSSQLVQNKNMKLIGDDLVIVSSEGRVYPYLKALWVHPHELSHSNRSPDIFDGSLDRYQWRHRHQRYGQDGVRRRVPLETFYNKNSLSHEIQDVTTVVYLVRKDQDDIAVDSIASSVAAGQAASTIVADLSPFTTKYLPAITSVNQGLPSVASVENSSKMVFSSTFEKAQTYLLTIPPEASPDRVADFVIENVL